MSCPSLNFDQAVYEGNVSAPDQCAYCGRGIASEYYRVSGHLACPVCAEKAQSLIPPDSHKVFAHALSYGAAAAVLGCIGYALVVIATGWTIGYAAIGVGYLVGWAMRRAAKGPGGRRYQWAAALLTYAAVAMAFVPIALHASSKHTQEQKAVSQQTPGGPASHGTTAVQPVPAKAPSHGVQWGRFLLAITELLGLGLISPFLILTESVGSGLLNLFIMFIGVQYAWKAMAVKTVSVDGPFEAVPMAD